MSDKGQDILSTLPTDHPVAIHLRAARIYNESLRMYNAELRSINEELKAGVTAERRRKLMKQIEEADKEMEKIERLWAESEEMFGTILENSKTKLGEK